jgi:hypothetical protein
MDSITLVYWLHSILRLVYSKLWKNVGPSHDRVICEPPDQWPNFLLDLIMERTRVLYMQLKSYSKASSSWLPIEGLDDKRVEEVLLLGRARGPDGDGTK